MNYQKNLLANGLRVITVPLPAVESVTAMILVGVGSRYEEKSINGISHFLEHLAFKGTKKRPSALAISSLIDGVGGEFNAFTGKDHTGYYVKAAATHLPLILDVLSDMLLNSLLAEEEIEKEKGVIIEEINLYEDTPAKKVADLYENLLYDKSSLGQDIIGEKEVIRSLKRKDFLTFLEKFYRPGNTVVGIAGGGKLAVDLVEKYLGKWAKKKTPPFKKVKEAQKKPQILLSFKETNQAHLCLGVRSYSLFHPKKYALEVLTAILGGGMSSRLFLEVRERRGLAYYVKAYNSFYQDVGNLVVQAGVEKRKIGEAIKVCLWEFARLREEKIKEKELKKAKEYLKGRLILEMEDSREVASLFAGSELLLGKVQTPKEIKKEIEKVTAEEVKSVAREIFQAKGLNLAVIGPYRESGKFEKILKFT